MTTDPEVTAIQRLAWATRVAADCADRQMRDAGRAEWNADDRLLADNTRRDCLTR